MVLGLRQSAYYKWVNRAAERLEKIRDHVELVKKVRKVFDDNEQVYGYRKMREKLIQEGIELSSYSVRRIMKQNGMYPVVVKKYKPTHNGKHDGRFLDDLLKQNFSISAPNKVWAGDITYIRTKLGFVYLAVVLDLYNKEIIGYSVSKSIDTELVKTALGNAVIRSGKRHEKTIFHSDRGCQYASKSFQAMLEQFNLTGSMSRPACPYDNACAESFFSTAKRECIYRKANANMDDVKMDLFRCIELFYNRKRIHSSLGYMSPVDYKLKYAA